MTAANSLLELQINAERREDISRVYQNIPILLQFMTALGWGGELLNLGFFRNAGMLKFLHLIPSQTRLARAQRTLVRKSVDLLSPRPSDSVLDVACGRGYTANFIANHIAGTNVTGMDLLPENTQQSLRRFGAQSHLSFVTGDACNMPLPEHTFERLLCLEAAFHFPDREKFLAEAQRVLVQNGRMLIVDFMWNSDDRSQTTHHPMTNIVKKTWAWNDFSSSREYTDLLQRNGFVIVERIDWTKQVTACLQWQFNMVANLAASRFGQKILGLTNPALKQFRPEQWREIRAVAKAHNYVTSRSRYIAILAEKK